MICGNNNTYSEKYYIDVVDALDELGVEQWKEWVKEVFNPADAAALIAWADNAEITGDWELPETFNTQIQKTNDSTLFPTEERFRERTVMEYLSDYGGNPKSDSVDMQTNVDTELVFALVYDPEKKQYYHANDNDVVNYGFTIINHRLRKMREGLANRLIELLDLQNIPDYEFTDDVSFTNFINTVLLYTENELIKRTYRKNVSISPDLRNTFIKLAAFDELVENSGFVKINPNSRIDMFLGKDRYIFTGEVIDYSKSMFDEHAGTEEYSSKLVKIILNSIDCLYANDKPTGMKLTFDGFQTAIMEVIDYALSGKDAGLFQLITDPDEFNLKEIVDKYRKTRGTTTIKQALNGISKYLFDDEVPIPIKEMFAAQAYTTVKAIYIEYKLGNYANKKKFGVVASKAEDKTIDQVKNRLLDKLVTKIESLIQKKDTGRYDTFKQKLRVKEEDGVYSFYPAGTNRPPVKFKYNKFDNRFDFVENPYTDTSSNAMWRIFLQRYLDLPLSNTSECNRVLATLKNSNGSIFSYFNQMIGALIYTLETPGNLEWKINDKITSGKLYRFVENSVPFMTNLLENELKKVVKDQNGNNLPPFQMISLAYRTPYLIRKIRDDYFNGIVNVKQDNLFVEDPSALGETSLRQSAEVNGVVKDVSEMSGVEALMVAMFTDFYQSLNNGGNIRVQPMTYSDKTRHMLKEIILANIKIKNGTSEESLGTLLKDLSKKTISGKHKDRVAQVSNLIYEEIRKRRFSEANLTLQLKLNRFAKVYGISTTIRNESGNEIQKPLLVLLDEVNTELSTKTIDQIQEDFRRKRVDFFSENDVDRTDVGVTINRSLVDAYITYSDLSNTINYFERLKIESAFDLLNAGFRINSLMDPSLKHHYKDLGEIEAANWINSYSGEMQLFKIKDDLGNEIEYTSDMTVDSVLESGYTVELCPMINSYFMMNALVCEQIRTIQIGSDYNFSEKGDPENDSITNRFITQSKRAMGQGATVQKFDTTRTFGVGKVARKVSIKDLRRRVHNPQGDSKNELINDGAGYLSPEQFLLESWSVPGNVKPRGDVVKSIFQFINKEGSLEQIKWAADVISNLRMRGAEGTDLSLREMYRLTHSDQINVNFNIQDFYGDFVYNMNGRPITCTETLYYKDNETGQYWRIDSVNNYAPNVIERTITLVDETGKELGHSTSEKINVNSIYDLFTLFGGEWCMNLDRSSGILEYTEMNHEILANIICVNKLKDKFIGYVVNESAYKVGMNNVNPETAFENRDYKFSKMRRDLKNWFSIHTEFMPPYFEGDPNTVYGLSEETILELIKENNLDDHTLWESEMDMTNSGWVLDAGHEVKDGHVTEMSQLVSLLIEKGYCTDIISEIYNHIADVTKAGLEKFNDSERVREIISEILVDSLSSGSNNIVSITDDFIKGLQSRVAEEGIPLKLPFSSPSIRSKFATSICASINRAALRRKYAGLGTVQTASVGQMCTSRIGAFDLTYEEVCDWYRDALHAKGRTIKDLFIDSNSVDPRNEVTGQYVWDMLDVKATIKPYNQPEYEVPVMEAIHCSEITFQDTIVIPTEVDGIVKYKVVKINDISTRDRIKHLHNTTVYRWNTKSRDLVQQLSYYTGEDGQTHDIYDFDESRLVFYLTSPKIWQTWSIEEQNLIRQFIALKTGKTFEDILNNKELDSEIFTTKQNLQERLNLLSDGYNEIFINGQSVNVINSVNKGADIMMGNAAMNRFGVTTRDSVSKILLQGPQFFLKKIEANQSLSPKDVPERQYDAILYTEDGEKILIQFGENPNRNDENLFIGNSFTKSIGKLRYKGEDLGSSNGVKEFVYKGAQGGYYKVLRLSDPTILNRLKNSRLFSDIKYSLSEYTDFKEFCKVRYSKYIDENGRSTRRFKIGNFVINNESDVNKVFDKYKDDIVINFKADQYNDIQRKNKLLAEKQFVAFKRFLECIGTRIPSQALQSCAKCRIIGFTGSRTNDVYVPQTLTWVAGSDYDIDKFFIMMYDIMKDGTLPNISGITNPYFDPIDLGKLPDGNGTKYEINISSNNSKFNEEVFVTKEQLYAINRGDFQELRNLIGQLKPNSEIVIVDPELQVVEATMLEVASGGISVLDINDIPSIEYRNEITNFYETVNEWSTHKKSRFAKKYRDAAERNQVVASIASALSQHSVQLALQNAVSMDDAKNAAPKISVKLNNDNIYSRFKQQEDNMIAKTGIASVAVAQKAFNGISFSFNYTQMELANEIELLDLTDQEAIQRWLDKLMSICILRKDGEYMSLANINFRKLKSVIKKRIAEFTGSQTELMWLIAQRDFIQQLDKNTNKVDAINLFSNIMSAATDNAKELLLARLNAVGDNIDLYTYLFATGNTFQEAADKMNSEVFKVVNIFKKKNMFEMESHRITLDNTLRFMSDDDYLPTVNRYIVKSIFNQFRNGQFESNSFMDKVIKLNIGEINNEIVNFINELFKGRRYFNNVGEIIRFMQYADNDVSKKLQEIDDEITNIEKLCLRLLKYSSVQDILTGTGSEKGILTRMIDAKSGTQQEIDYYDDGHEEQVSLYNAFNYKNADLDDLRRVYDYFVNKVYKKHMLFEPTAINLAQLEDLKSLTKKADEFAILGRKIFSINQGMKVGDYEEWSWINAINTAINRRFYDKYKNKERVIYKFDFIRFMTDPAYAEFMCKEYEDVKSTVNILKVVQNSPHYEAMIKSAITARDLIEHSYVAKETRSIAKKLMNGISSDGNWIEPLVKSETVGGVDIDVEYVFGTDVNAALMTRSLNSSEFKSIVDCVNEHLILNFFTHLEPIVIPISSTQIAHKYVIGSDKIQMDIVSDKDQFMLNTIDGLATFKIWMDDFFIPTLKEQLSKSGRNAFADFLIQTSIENKTYGTKKFVWNIDKDIRTAQPGQRLYKNKADVVASFNDIIQKPISSILGNDYNGIHMSIGDLLYLYNLYIFKGKSDGMDFLFADAAASGNRSEWVNNFQRYVTQLDDSKIKREETEELFDITVEDVVHKVVNTNNAWRFNLRMNKPELSISTNTRSYTFSKPEFIQNSDILFEIGSAYTALGGTNVWEGFSPYEYFTFDSTGKIVNRRVKATSSEVMHIIIEKLNVVLKSAGITVVEYSNNDLNDPNIMGEVATDFTKDEKENIKNKRGFVYNGKIYINVDASMKNLENAPNFPKILVHELAHIIAANLHYNPKYSEKYTELLIRLWRSASPEEQNRFKANYPNKKTTDLMEEYFVECIAKSFDAKLKKSLKQKWDSVIDGVPSIENITLGQLQYDIQESLKDIFELDDSFDNVDFSKLLGTDISQAVGMFNSGLFNFSKAKFNTRIVKLSQGLATVKNMLFNENKIIEDCN